MIQGAGVHLGDGGGAGNDIVASVEDLAGASASAGGEHSAVHAALQSARMAIECFPSPSPSTVSSASGTLLEMGEAPPRPPGGSGGREPREAAPTFLRVHSSRRRRFRPADLGKCQSVVNAHFFDLDSSVDQSDAEDGELGHARPFPPSRTPSPAVRGSVKKGKRPKGSPSSNLARAAFSPASPPVTLTSRSPTGTSSGRRSGVGGSRPGSSSSSKRASRLSAGNPRQEVERELDEDVTLEEMLGVACAQASNEPQPNARAPGRPATRRKKNTITTL